MKVLVLGRLRPKLDAVLETLRTEGFDGVGVTVDEEALSLLGNGNIGALVIGGGVGPEARAELKRVAGAQGTTVVEANLAGHSEPEAITRYVRDHLVPQLG